MNFKRLRLANIKTKRYYLIFPCPVIMVVLERPCLAMQSVAKLVIESRYAMVILMIFIIQTFRNVLSLIYLLAQHDYSCHG